MARRKKVRYEHSFLCFDIETSHDVIDGCDQVWTWSWQVMRDDGTYCTPGSWPEALSLILDGIPDGCRRIVFVHYLGFEMEAIARNLGGHVISDVFARDPFHPLYFLLDGKAEFRCSYFLTNKSLAACGKDVGLPKLEMDYDKIRTPGCVVSGEEAAYVRRDVEIIVAKIRQLEEQEGLHFWEFPLTNTGFLRNELRLVMRSNPANRKWFTSSRLDYARFMLCRDCFCGGYVHANYIFAGMLCHDVDSFDYGSAYPFNMLVHKYPTGFFHRVDHPDKEDLLRMLARDDVLFICRIRMAGDAKTGRRIMSKTRNTFLSLSKCKTDRSVITDNGRVVSCMLLETALTSLDLAVVLRCYDFAALDVMELYWAQADYLPREYVMNMLKYYEMKQSLKGVAGREGDYIKSKNRVNSYFGMAVTNPLHDEVSFNTDKCKWSVSLLDYSDRAAVSEALDQFYSSRKSFLPYQVGVFVPAWTRYHLWMDFILRDGNDSRTVYCDTDSAKVVEKVACLSSIDAYNRWAASVRSERLKSLGLDPELYPDLGRFDCETAKTGAYREFRTLGAKKYAYLEDGKIHSTVSGLSKSASAALRSMDDFVPGVVFGPGVSGRTVTVPVTNTDNPWGDGGGLWLRDTSYTLGVGADYEDYAGIHDRRPVLIERDGDGYRYTQLDDPDIGTARPDIDVIMRKRSMYGVTWKGGKYVHDNSDV